MTGSSMVFLSLVLGAPAMAEDDEKPPADAPEFLLGDVGVRIDLPEGWKMTRWSDWDFTAEKQDEKLLLFAWRTMMQVEPSEEQKDGWQKLHLGKAEDLKGADPKITGTVFESHAKLPSVVSDLEFSFGGDTPMRMTVVSIPVEGNNFHLAVAANADKGAVPHDTAVALADRLDVRAPPKAAETGPFSVLGMNMSLPAGFRKPLESELDKASRKLKDVGEESMANCIIGIRPIVAAEPEVFGACTMKRVWLGKIDSYSLAGTEAKIREMMFGEAPVSEGTAVTLSDRIGLHYKLEGGTDTLHVGVVPYDEGVARVWAIGPKSDEARLAAAVETSMTSATFSGPHPVSVSNWIDYLMYRPAWLAASIAGLVVASVGFFGGLVVMIKRGNQRVGERD